MTTYEQFLERKTQLGSDGGFEPTYLPDFLFPFQRHLVEWAVRKGRSAIFAGCGLGKTAMQLAWAKNIAEHTGKPTLILAPLAVAQQTVSEGAKFGISVKYCRCQAEVSGDIVVANYEMLHEFDAEEFGGVCIDESSILKAFMGKRKRQIVEMFSKTLYKLACTATPAPNDHMELGNHAEFLGVMRSSEMLARYFINDSSNVGRYRLKGHAQIPFWEWVCSWAATIERPSDIGFPDDGFDLPKCETIWRTVDCTKPADGYLFQLPASSMSERISARRNSVSERCAEAARIANSDSEQWLIYCALNDESEELARIIDGAREVRGSMDNDRKVEEIQSFIAGETRCLVSKPTICGFGMNFQFCRNVMFVGMSDSWEQYYQAKRRVWRFGQTKTVRCHIITASTEGAVVDNILRKERDASEMVSALSSKIGEIMKHNLKPRGFTKRYEPANKIQIPSFL